MKYNLKNFERLKFPLSEEEQAMLLKELDMMEAELRDKLERTPKLVDDRFWQGVRHEIKEVLGE